jgi:hypothetical protein
MKSAKKLHKGGRSTHDSVAADDNNRDIDITNYNMMQL